MTDKVQRGGMLDRLAIIFLIVGIVLTTVAYIMNFTVVTVPQTQTNAGGSVLFGEAANGVQYEVTNTLMFSQKIFYFHMPVAVVSLGILAFTAIYGILFLVKRDHRYDLLAKVATEISMVFILMTMATGEFWTAFEWQGWWVWEPRLTTYLILTLLVIGYFILRNAVDDPERRATFASVFGILAFADAAISLVITRVIPSSRHPVITREGGLEPMMIACLVICMVGMIALAFGLYRYRLREQRLKQRLEAIKESLED